MIVVVLRHADRESDSVDDLSAAGRARAELLARMLAESGVSAAYTSDAQRARHTLEPLEQRLGAALTAAAIGFGGGPNAVAAHVQAVVQAVRSEPAGATVVVVGHSNTVEPIILGLGGQPVGPIGADEFDKLFILLIDPSGAVIQLRLRYGAPTP